MPGQQGPGNTGIAGPDFGPPQMQSNPFGGMGQGPQSFGQNFAQGMGQQLPQMASQAFGRFMGGPNIGNAGQPGGGINGGLPFDMKGLGAAGVGGFAGALGGAMQENAQRKQQGAQNAMGLYRDQANLAQQQLGDRQNAALTNLKASPAMSDIEPYAQAALRRAMSGAFSPVTFVDDPTGTGRRVSQGGFDTSKLQPIMDQFYNDRALAASAANQEALRMAVDPYSFKSGTQSAIYGNEANQGNYDDLMKFQQQRQQQYGGFEGQAQDALKQALEANKEAYKPDSGWKMFGKALLGGGLGAAKSFLSGGLM